MDRERLVDRLDTTFDGSDAARRAISRQARDMADAGRIEDELGYELTVEAVVSNLQDAPNDHSLTERWNWWIGSLDLSHGGYQRFAVRADID